MRITGGEYRGRTFQPPKIEGFRPTMEKVRLAVFSMLSSYMDISDLRILDCYSGSGAFGFESISRGASECVFIEKNPELIKFSQSVSLKLGVVDKCKFIRGNLPADLEDVDGAFHIIFVDPPYEQNPVDFITNILNLGKLSREGILVLETSSRKTSESSDVELSLETLRDKRYGDTRIQILRNKSG